MAEAKRIPAAVAGIAADPPYLAKLTARFWRKVAKSEHGCWEWTAAKFEEGYGAFSIRRVGNVRAPRVAYWLATGAWPEGLFVCHRCDNPGCVRPEHLFVGTNTDNMRDCLGKGRRPHQIASEAYRATMAQAGSKISAAKRARTHCKRGHHFSFENTRVGENGYRTCLVCVRSYHPEYAKKWKALNRDRINELRRKKRAEKKAIVMV